MSEPRCRHLIIRTESYIIELRPPYGEYESSEPTYCCDAAEGCPDRFVGLPPFLLREALAGHRLKYPQDCRACGMFEAGEPRVNP